VMTSRESVLAELKRLSPLLKRRYGVEIVGLIGSRAREDQRDDSDIDLAYTIESGTGQTLLDIGGAHEDIRASLGLKIDMVDWNHVDPRYKRHMERDLVRIDG
jgi:uncharacterized protein